MKRPLIFCIALTFLIEGCGSSRMSVDLIPPQIRIREAPGQLRPGKNEERVPLYLMVDVFNESSEAITLKRLSVRPAPYSQSGIKFEPVTRDFSIEIAPGSVRTVDLHIVAWVELPNLDANSRTTIRTIAHFNSDLGGFRRVYNLPLLLNAQ